MSNMNKIISIILIAATVTSTGAFYGGMKYERRKAEGERQIRLPDGQACFQ